MVACSHFAGIVGDMFATVALAQLGMQLISSESTPTEARGVSLRGR